MKIISLELKGSLRLELSGIDKITIKPETSIMAIIGSNGCGKSSLLYYLSPNVPDKNDFTKDGYKKIIIEHNNVTYTLFSDLSNNKHSFVNNLTGEELNVGGTPTMQRQLVKDYFNYSDKIHNILIGRDKFTQMPPNKRKELFTMLCDSDYTFAMNVFNKAKEKHRDVVGAIKKLTQHLMQLTNLDSDKEELSNIIKSINHHELKIEELQKISNYEKQYSDTYYSSKLDEKLNNNIKEIDVINRELSDITTIISNRLITEECNGDNVKELNSLKEKLSSVKMYYDYLIKEYTALELKLKNINFNSKENINAIESQIEFLEKEVNILNELHISKTNKNNYANDNAETRYKLLSDLNVTILEIINNLSNFGDLDITRKYLNSLEDDINSFKNKHTELNIYINRLDEKLTSMEKREKENEVNCPNCNHSFHPGFNKDLYLKLKKIKNEKIEKINEIKKIINDKQEHYNTCLEKHQHLDNFVKIGRMNEYVLSEWVIDIVSNKYYLKNPAYIRISYNDYIEHLGYVVKKNSLVNKINSLREIINKNNTIEESKYKDLEEQLTLLNNKVNLAKKEIKELELSIKSLEEVVNLYNLFLEKRNLLNKLIKDSDDIILDIYKFEFYKVCSNLISKEREYVSSLSKRHTEIITREKNIEMVSKQIEDLKEEMNTWESIVDSLNPQDGLIAEGLLGYIKVFLSKVNGFIKNIWTYPLVVHPAKYSEDGDGELSYRFPITVGLSTKQRSDVSLGSDGILEVIDLAFKIIAMRSLGLKGYPIFLDEFGRTFDAKHRENALKLIEKLSEEFIEDQIFIVSHSFSEYSVINDISFCVLSEDNIILPPGNINKGVIIER